MIKSLLIGLLFVVIIIVSSFNISIIYIYRNFQYKLLLSLLNKRNLFLGFFIFTNLIYIFQYYNPFILELYINNLPEKFLDLILEPLYAGSDPNNNQDSNPLGEESSAGGNENSNSEGGSSAGGDENSNPEGGSSGEGDGNPNPEDEESNVNLEGLQANQEWKEKAGDCEHRTRDRMRFVSDEDQAERPIPCDFDHGGGNHYALDGPFQEAILCQNCHAVICSNCAVDNSDSDND